MKRLILVFLFLFFSLEVVADDIVLDTPETLATPTAARISDWEITKINADQRRMEIRYRWFDGSDNLIRLNPSGWLTWTCRDVFQDLNPVSNEDCIAAGNPDPCCTDVGDGTCDDLTQTDDCFTSIFGFQIRTQDVGTSIGSGFRQLIWNEMKQDILTPGNDGSFE